MTNAKIDQNDVKTWLAYNETTKQVEPVQVDPVTGSLLVYVVSPDSNTPIALNEAKIDQNDAKTITAWNDTSGKVEAMRCGANGELLIIAQ